MFAVSRRWITRRTNRTFPLDFLLSTIAARVTVLLLTVATYGALRADSASSRVCAPTERSSPVGDATTGVILRVFEFTCEFHLPIGRGRLHGLMASDDSRCRIALYWVESDLVREGAAFLRYSDFLFVPGLAYYWIQGLSQPGIVQLSDRASGPLLAHGNSPESVVRSALAILRHTRGQDHDVNTPLELGRFLQASGGRAEYAWSAQPSELKSDHPSRDTHSDVHTLNALPYGREYSKETQADGTVVWRARRASTGQPVVSVVIKPATSVRADRRAGMFETETLGQCPLIPDAYKVYWAFDRAYSGLKGSADERIASRELYDEIGSYLDGSNNVPPEVCGALDRLGFKAVLLTGDIDSVRRSAEACAARLLRDNSAAGYQSLLELARISGQIEKHYPQEPQEWFRPLVRQLLQHAGREAVGGVDRLITIVAANKWFIYGKFLLEGIHEQSLMDEHVLNTLIARLDATRIAGNREPLDPTESSQTVRRYLAQIDDVPPEGTMDMNDVRHVVEKGLAKCYPAEGSETKWRLVENTVRSIHLIAGEGPFCGSQVALITSIERFAFLYLAVRKATEPIDTVLATFLALSFYDISTPQDHAALLSQFHSACAEVQTQINAMLAERGLDSLVAPTDVADVRDEYEQIFARYVNDPLWPAFKFPLTHNEEARLTNKLKLELLQLGPLLDQMGAKVKYGGTSADLKARTVFDVSRLFEQLLAETAFLRNPPYPGVSCQYRGEHGFTAVIPGSLYEDGDRPKEKFKAMRYYHLGHRLEEAVVRERELMLGAMKQEMSHEAEPSEDN